MLARFRKISFIMAYAVATIPLWHYISEAHILFLMISVIIFAYLNVVLSSVESAQAILSSEKAKTPLPRWLPNDVKYEKWWLIVRHTLKWHLLLVPAKMGLALGFSQFLFVAGLPFNVIPLSETYNYIAYNGITPPPIYPQWETSLITLFFLIAFAILENLLIATLNIATKQMQKPTKWFFTILTLRIGLALSLLGFMVLLRPLQNPYLDYFSSCAFDHDWYSLVRDEISQACFKTRVMQTLYTGLFTPFDQSILLGANIMRPISQLSLEERYYNIQPDDPYANKRWDNRLFILRQCVAGILGIFLYLGITWAILWFVEDEPQLKPL
jgi:hypothetical protein